MIFDTHCHYNLDPILEDWQNQWQMAQDHGVTKSMLVGADLPSSQKAVELAKLEKRFRAAIAIHPTEYQELIENTAPSDEEITNTIKQQITELEKLVSDKNVAAIGETGLDYFRLPSDIGLQAVIKEAQYHALIAHLELAQTHSLPVILHVRDTGISAYSDLLKILKNNYHSDVPFVLHCVSGPPNYIQAAIEMGAYIGLAGNVTYNSAEAIRIIAKSVPKDRILLETDAPFLPPQGWRGKLCQPWMISVTADFVQDELNLDLEQIFDNSTRVFKF